MRNWDENRDVLYNAIRSHDVGFQYYDLVKLAIDCILNHSTEDYEDCGYSHKWDTENITVIDNGDYQGTLLFMIPAKCYQPSECEYLLTFAGYGSCGGCDALLSIVEFAYEMTDEIARDLLTLCKHLIENIVKPYNYGWRMENEYETFVESKGEEK
jgi:hypothetical protein